MCSKYQALRKQLDDLGYKQVLVPEAVPLVDRLLSDLLKTTESLQKYMTVARQAIEERDNLELGAEPYKCDNAKLVKECNELHLALLQYREQNEKIQKNLKRQVNVLEAEIFEANSEKAKLKSYISELESKARILGRKPSKTVSSTSVIRNKPVSKASLQSTPTMALAEQKIANLTKEIKKLKEDHLQLFETAESYKNQINSRDREIQRLTAMLEGGRPTHALNTDCCYRDTEGRLARLQDNINVLRREKLTLEDRLKESVMKQHEAMKRALHLAERNKQLEKELKDIDQMALAVEKEANSIVSENSEKISRLQDRLNQNVLQIQCLEKEVADLRREKQALCSDLEAVKLERNHLQVVLETTLEDKKHLTDRINQFTIIEHDLNIEIDRLMRLSADQKRKIAELECQVFSGRLDKSDVRFESKKSGKAKSKSLRPVSPVSPPPPPSPTKHVSKKKHSKTIRSKSPSRKDHATGMESHRSNKSPSPERMTSKQDVCRCCNSQSCVERLKQLFEQEMEHRKLQYTTETLEKVRSEKEHYMKEYYRLVEQMKNIPDKPAADSNLVQDLNDREQKILALQRELSTKISEKEQEITRLQQENKTLSQEKYSLMCRLETARDRPDSDVEGLSLRSAVKRLERERELLRGDVQRLEEERDAIRQRLKCCTENQVAEHARMEKSLLECEEQIRKLEQERRELMQTQGSRRATINHLEEQCESLREQYKNSQVELTQQRTLYSQLKTLHEQTDRALADSQGQVRQLEAELTNAQERIRSLEKERGGSDQEVNSLKQDVLMMKGSLAQLDQEKDKLLITLDDKTEKQAALELQLKDKNRLVIDLETKIAELTKQISLTAENSSARDHLIKTITAENANLKKELESALKLRDTAVLENKRIQEELANCAAEGRKAHNELEIAKRQIEDLKTQLQQYVAEVKRAEDLISQKELERSELLDQFRSLSKEATELENNNHTLDVAATESKVQLTVALEHVMDLERKLETQETMIKGYEKQIADMTSQIASLEMQLKQCNIQQERLQKELDSMNALCVTLDKQKDNLSQDIQERDMRLNQVSREVERLRKDSENAQELLSKDKTSVQHLEKLLADTRRESVEQKLLNNELQCEVKRLKNKSEELQSLLSSHDVSKPKNTHDIAAKTSSSPSKDSRGILRPMETTSTRSGSRRISLSDDVSTSHAVGAGPARIYSSLQDALDPSSVLNRLSKSRQSRENTRHSSVLSEEDSRRLEDLKRKVSKQIARREFASPERRRSTLDEVETFETPLYIPEGIETMDEITETGTSLPTMQNTAVQSCEPRAPAADRYYSSTVSVCSGKSPPCNAPPRQVLHPDSWESRQCQCQENRDLCHCCHCSQHGSDHVSTRPPCALINHTMTFCFPQDGNCSCED